MARSRRAQNGCRRHVGWMPPARRRHAESALSRHRPYGTSAQIVRTESRRVNITGQRISAPTRALAARKHPRRRAARSTQHAVGSKPLWVTSLTHLSSSIRSTAVLQSRLSDDLAARGRSTAGSHEDGLALASRWKEQG
jgi:uncharacterized protein (DUF342 family)